MNELHNSHLHCSIHERATIMTHTLGEESDSSESIALLKK